MNEQGTYRELVLAYLQFREHEGRHAELASFYRRRYSVMTEIFGLDLSFPSSMSVRETRNLHTAFRVVASFYPRITTPFEGFLEAPAVVVKLVSASQERLAVLAAEQKEICLDLLCKLVEAIHGPTELRVENEELERRGVAESQAPDSVDYL